MRPLKRPKNDVLNRWVSLSEGLILTEIMTLVTESAVLIRGGGKGLLRGVSACWGLTVEGFLILIKPYAFIPEKTMISS